MFEVHPVPTVSHLDFTIYTQFIKSCNLSKTREKQLLIKAASSEGEDSGERHQNAQFKDFFASEGAAVVQAVELEIGKVAGLNPGST